MALTWHGHGTDTRGRGTGIAPTCLALAPTWHSHGAGTTTSTRGHSTGMVTAPLGTGWGHHPGATAPPVAPRHMLGPVLPGVGGNPPKPVPPQCGR